MRIWYGLSVWKSFLQLQFNDILSRLVEMVLVFDVIANDSILAVFEILNAMFYSEVC